MAKNHFPLADLIASSKIEDLSSGRIDAFFGMASPCYLHVLKNSSLICINFGSLLGAEYLSYAIAQNEATWREFINQWLSLKKQSGFYQKQYDYWIKGNPLEETSIRWNLLDVIRTPV